MSDNERKLKYLTGEIAEYFSLSNMGILYLEKKGIIQSERKKNGYRTYSADELTKLGEIRAFERMGFSLKEASCMQSNTKDSIENKKKELLKQLELIEYYQSIQEIEPIKLNESLNDNNCSIEMYEEMYWCPCWEEQYNLDNLNKEVIDEMKQIDCSWLNAMPYMHYCSKVDVNNFNACRGNSIEMKYAKKENVVVTNLVEKLESSKSLVFVTEVDNYEHIINKAKSYLDTKKLEMSSNAYFRILGSAVLEDTDIYITKVIIPLK